MMSDRLLHGRSVLITGASAGIGRVTALALAGAGAAVFATGRRSAALEELAQACNTLGNPIRTLAGDLGQAEFIAELAGQAGDVDILINNAGVLTFAPLLDMDLADCADMFNTNVLATFALTQAIARRMVARQSGHIIMVTSTGAREVFRFGGVYCASKHALSALARALRLELQSSGIRVTEIAPGSVDTSIRDNIKHEATRAAFNSRTYSPLTPEEVAEAIVYAAATPPNCCADLVELRPRGAA